MSATILPSSVFSSLAGIEVSRIQNDGPVLVFEDLKIPISKRGASTWWMQSINDNSGGESLLEEPDEVEVVVLTFK